MERERFLRGTECCPALGVPDISNCSRRDRHSGKERQKEFYVILMNVCFLFQINNAHNSVILCFFFFLHSLKAKIYFSLCDQYVMPESILN